MANEQANTANGDSNLFELFAANINDIVAIHDLDGLCRYLSPSVQKVLGYTVEDLLETYTVSFCHPDDAWRIRALLDTDEEGVPAADTRCEYRFRRKDGSYCWLESEASRITDGTVKQLLVITRDITGRKQAEQELKESYDQLALAIDGARAGVWGFEPANRNIVYRQWWTILGYAAGEVPAGRENWLSLCHPEDIARIETAINDCLAGRTDKFELEFRSCHKDGTYRWVQANGKLVGESAGKSPHWAGLIIDVTERKHLEEVWQESASRLRDFAQAVPDFSMILDEDGCHVEVFGHHVLLPKPAEELRGLTLHQVLRTPDADFYLNAIRRVLRTGKPETLINEVSIDGVRRVAEGRMVPMRYRAAGKRTVALVIADITAKQRAEKAAAFAFTLRRHTEFVDSILQGKPPDARMLATAKGFDIDLFGKVFCCLVHIEQNGGTSLADDCTLQNSIIEMLSDKQRFFLWDSGGDIGVICRNDAVGRDLEEGLRIARWLMDAITAYEAELSVTIGVGSTCSGLEGIRKSLRQAATACLVGRSRRHGGREICHYRQLGIYQLLARVSGEEEAREFAAETLGRLIEYDGNKGTELMRTLEEVLRSVNLKEASQRLFLHYNTAVRQKRRIESILGVSLDDVETRLALSAAMKLYNLRL